MSYKYVVETSSTSWKYIVEASWRVVVGTTSWVSWVTVSMSWSAKTSTSWKHVVGTIYGCRGARKFKLNLTSTTCIHDILLLCRTHTSWRPLVRRGATSWVLLVCRRLTSWILLLCRTCTSWNYIVGTKYMSWLPSSMSSTRVVGIV